MRKNILKPGNGRNRAIIEDVQPQLACGRFPVKRIAGDTVHVTAAIYGDGHDHVAARLLFRPESESEWRSVPMQALDNDLWHGSFEVDVIGEWLFTVQAWIDHFGTWSADLRKRIDAQMDGPPPEPVEGDEDAVRRWHDQSRQLRRDISLAYRSGAALLDRSHAGARGDEAGKLKAFASQLRSLAEKEPPRFEYPVTQELYDLAKAYPDLSFASTYEHELHLRVDRERARFSTWYEFFPRSASDDGRHGTLQDATKLLPEIARSGFDVVYLPPIHPIGQAFRKGKNNSTVAEKDDTGSPWAIGSLKGGHTAIHLELGTMQDFDHLVETARALGMEIALDIAFQCSPDHPWVRHHPEWFSIRPDGSIQYAENPPKKYQDIYPLNFEAKDWQNLWRELLGVFLFWVRRGVRIFRVDNPHTKALPFWEWCIAEVQRWYPDVLFLAEAFTRPHVMYGLAKRGFSQSYTYFSWRETKADLTAYMQELITPPVSEFFRPNFWPNTPDILPGNLQTGLRSSFEMRAILAATLSSSYGIYGPAFELMEHTPVKPGSEEYLDSEKYQIRQWDRDRPDSLMPLLRTLNNFRHEHRALQHNDSLLFHSIDHEQLLCYSKRDGDDVVLVIVNLNPRDAVEGWTDLNMQALGLGYSEHFEVHDLLTGETYAWQGAHNYVRLNPEKAVAHVLHVRQTASENRATPSAVPEGDIRNEPPTE